MRVFEADSILEDLGTVLLEEWRVLDPVSDVDEDGVAALLLGRGDDDDVDRAGGVDAVALVRPTLDEKTKALVDGDEAG